MAEFIPIGKEGIYGKLSLATDPNAPLVICYGGIDVGGKRSGIYMYNYFDESFMKKYHLFVAYSSKTSGKESYNALVKVITERKVQPCYEILYLFSGGYQPGLALTSELAKFRKIYLVDIWIGKTLTWVQLAEKDASAKAQPVATTTTNTTQTIASTKFVYFWTPGGHNNADGNARIRKVAENQQATDHMSSNIIAVRHINTNFNTPWPVTKNAAQEPSATNVNATVASIGDDVAKNLSLIHKNEITYLSDLRAVKSENLLSTLKKSIANTNIKKLVLSIGAWDSWSFFSGVKSSVGGLKRSEFIGEIKRVFPNAELYIVNGTWGWAISGTGLTDIVNLFPDSQCDDSCWSKKIDAFMLNFTDTKFQVIGTKTKVDTRPDVQSPFMLSLADDLRKYKIIAGSVSVAQQPTQQAPVGQEVSRGDLNNGGNEKKQDSQKNQLSTNGIVNLFQSTILPSQIKIPAPLEEDQKKELVNGLGYQPVIWYNQYQIDITDVQYLGITYDDILPVLNLTFYDSIGLIKDTGTPIDNSKITVFVNPRSNKLRPVHVQFKIKTYTNYDGLMGISGILDIDGLYFKEYKSYKDSTSNKVLQDIAKAIGLGFNTNVVETNDRMNWLNTGQRPSEFMSEIVEHTYISDESFVSGNIDLFYNFNFVDVQKELSRDINQELGVMTSGLAEVLKIPNDPERAPLFLTSDESLKGNNNYFSSFKIVNRATDTALEKGYYDNFIYYDTSSKKALDFDIHSMNLNTDKSLVLKGANGNQKFYDNNKNFVYAGKSVADNSHNNYNYSKTHNERNILEAEKLVAEIELPFPNFNLYRYQKVKLVISHNASTLAAPAFNTRFSGDWLVVDIKYLFFERNFKQVVTVVKRELELTDEEVSRGVPVKNRPVGRGNYANPNTVPNGPAAPPVTPSAPTQPEPTRTNTQPSSTTGAGSTAPSLTEATKGAIVKGLVTKNMNFEQATIQVILNLEGGYYHPDMLKDGRVKDARYGTSGETMYGLDRKAGGPNISACAPCVVFWSLLDKANARTNWKWNYIPPEPLKTQLLKLTVEIMRPLYERNLNNYLPEKEIQKIINSDGRLMFHFIYASWNGPGWFRGWAREVREAYSKGVTKADDLVILCVKRRINNTGIVGNKSNNSLIAQGGRKIANIVGVQV